MILCKTENFQTVFLLKNVLPYSCTTTLHTIKGPGMDADMLFPPEKGPGNSIVQRQHPLLKP